MFDNILTLLPHVISLLSVIVACISVVSATHTAAFQQKFIKKTESYSEYWKALCELVYHPYDENVAQNLTYATYQASMYATPKVIRELNALTNFIFTREWQKDGGSQALDEIVNNVMHTLHDDLKSNRV